MLGFRGTPAAGWSRRDPLGGSEGLGKWVDNWDN